MTQIPKPLTVEELKVGMQIYNPITQCMQKVTDVVSYGNTTVFSLDGLQHGLYKGVYHTAEDHAIICQCNKMAVQIWNSFDWGNIPDGITVEELETICNILDKYT